MGSLAGGMSLTRVGRLSISAQGRAGEDFEDSAESYLTTAEVLCRLNSGRVVIA